MPTEIEIERASRNYEAQVALFAELRSRLYGGLTVEWVANDLGVTTDEAHSILAGEVDLTLSEVRYLANALGVVIEYRVGRLVD